MIGRPYPRGSVLCAPATSRHSLRYCHNKVFPDLSLASAYHYSNLFRLLHFKLIGYKKLSVVNSTKRCIR